MSAASRASLRSNRPRRTRRRAAPPIRRAASAAVLLAALAAVSACSEGTNGGGGGTNFVAGSDGVDTVEKGERAALPALSGKTVSGGHVDVADHRGKVVVINVWGSWCPPCRAEAKNFEAVYKDLKDDGVEFVGINTRDASTGLARAFEKEFGVTYPSLYDPTGKLMLRFAKGTLNPQAVPSTLVVDREGKIAARTLQALSEKKLREMIAPVLAEK
ncbi:TlpA disulfide reductase family protein [Streptomyces sp. NPDC006610]|jgi:thiol-disulfide isomerase/thioredoxin|uniref:TlpA family protein disulfide reductase n=1 Tax=Streptomyces sp. NPDC006610 TaxID=3154584 RepID=UPI0033BE7ADA